MSYKITIISKTISKGHKMQHIKDLLHSCSHLLITSGAGMSADSGLPTFRDKEGFWREYPALRELGIDFQEIANPSAFLFQLSLAWSFYAHRHNPYLHTHLIRATLCFQSLPKVRNPFSFSLPMWILTSSKQDFQVKTSMNATAISSFCNADVRTSYGDSKERSK